jgi:hypothetical protein
MDLRELGVVGWIFGRAPAVRCDECEVRVTFHTPFGTTCVNEKALTKLDAKELEGVAADLNAGSLTTSWTHVEGARLQLQGYGTSLYEDLERQVPRPILRAERRSCAAAPVTHEKTGITWSPNSAEVTVWNVGGALLTVEYSVSVPKGRTWADLTAAVGDCRADLSLESEGWVGIALADFATRAQVRKWLDHQAFRPAIQPFWSQPLWTFFWFSILAPRRASTGAVRRVARALVEKGEECPGAAAAEQSEIHIALEVCCVTRHSGDAADRADAQRLRHHVEAQTVCWGTAVTLDRLVWEKLAALQFEDQNTNRLDAAADHLLRLADKVSFFLVTMGGVSPHLDLSDAALWNCFDNGWRFPEVRRSLRQRLKAVHELQTEKAAQVGNARLRRLNRFVLGLTVVGVLASVVSLVDVVSEWDSVSHEVNERVEPRPEPT